MGKIKLLKLVMIILCLTGYLTASAQSDYVVIPQGDTLKGGKVVFLNYGGDQKVQYTDQNKKRTIYTMKQVKAFQLNDEIYHLVKHNDRYAYLKLITFGYLSLYAYQMNDRQNWDGRYLYKRDGRGMEVPNIGFKKRMLEFLSDCEELSDDISGGDLGRGDLLELINKYNGCIEQRTALSGIAQQQKIISVQKAATWNELEDKVKSTENLNDKETVLEMISEARSKTEKGEKIPKFLVDGLTKSLEGNSELQNSLAEVLKAINQ
ncbi:MAG: hypothetical protein JNK44_16535 [Cyclobacteriaceae bacterium]|nr:hypothetical protein [Cyclobacteriaceae bacterium]